MDPIVLDTLGRACPIPVIELAKAAETAAPGTRIEVLSDDPASKVDIPAWCRLKEQRFVGREDRSAGWAFVVEVR